MIPIPKKINFDGLTFSCDIGGTHANFCIAGQKKGMPTILYQTRESTTSVKHLIILINNFLDQACERGYKPSIGGFAVAGPVENRKGYQRVKLTNTSQKLDTREITRKTGLKNIVMMNDFVAVSYAINLLKPRDYVVLNEGKPEPFATKAVLGAGTGLGKGILYFDKKLHTYLPIPSEGGNTDLPLQTEAELKIARYIKSRRKLKRQIYYEDILSGTGLEDLYSYLNTTKYPKAPKKLSAEDISKSQKTNKCSSKTFELFVNFYARCARNFALDTLCKGGIYIAGGITVKNPNVFKKFNQEFINHGVYSHILKDIPIYLITNYDISLLGAVYSLTVG